MKDQLFNAESIGDLAAEYAAGVPGFDAEGFQAQVMSGLAERELMERLEWIADCLEPRLASNFPDMADQIEAAMPPKLDPSNTDDDFGRFIHAVPGILAVRHGLEKHRERALDLLYTATQRFSMEFYIRPFLNQWPEETWARLERWVSDGNYHVRRLVSEGTRPSLPWAKKIEIDPLRPLALLDELHADPTRFVTRSVANHLNDISKFNPDAVIERLLLWAKMRRQNDKELAWITRHALRTLIKQGHPDALGLLGYVQDVPLTAVLKVERTHICIGENLDLSAEISADLDVPVLVDYVMHFHRPNGRAGRKVFKWKQAKLAGGHPITLQKTHKLKGNATTFTLHPGAHRVELQVNGQQVAKAEFTLLKEA
ncbi:hypothetical protein [Roseovarius rhodophyticola]|uniref:DNA alkylation repair protein n=1 Tax=Roseovarius rhodophyticola TaxID=3080827 RepID=A0ABZ2TDG7_9RHOB|nr:hypothetical protein [Roseovarius sp. W115]MDV2931476.1 hypothetical protein [Roseovarius sp. W115]